MMSCGVFNIMALFGGHCCSNQGIFNGFLNCGLEVEPFVDFPSVE